MIVLARARAGSPGLGVSFSARSRCLKSRFRFGDAIFGKHRTRLCESRRVGDGRSRRDDRRIVGRYIRDNRVTTRAGFAAVASRPPLIAERGLRTVFISPIGAPERSKARFTACLSSSVNPGRGGRLSSEDPPPEISAITRSSSVSPSTIRRIRAAALRPFASGTGCAASTISMRWHGTAWP